MRSALTAFYRLHRSGRQWASITCAVGWRAFLVASAEEPISGSISQHDQRSSGPLGPPGHVAPPKIGTVQCGPDTARHITPSSADHQCRPVEDHRTSAGDQPPHPRTHPNHRPSVRGPRGRVAFLAVEASDSVNSTCDGEEFLVGGGVVDDPAGANSSRAGGNAGPIRYCGAAADLDERRAGAVRPAVGATSG